MHSEQQQHRNPAARVLILGGTSEARELAARVAADVRFGVISSLAGATRAPEPPAGDTRIGGFGGPERLTAFLADERITAVVDATHPFATAITASAVAAATSADVPLLVLQRPGWTQPPGRKPWHRVPSLAAAADLLPELGERVLLTTGRRSLAAFAAVDRCWFLSRSVDPPQPELTGPGRLTVVLDRGPFTVAAERALLIEHRIDVLVTKDSGGGNAKLLAADELGVPVVMVNRPPLPPGVRVVTTVEDAHRWLAS